MKTKISHFILLLVLASCTSENSTISEPDPLFQSPETLAINADDGYILNAVTGDSIQPIISSTGDTLITGKPVLANGIKMNPDRTSKGITSKVYEHCAMFVRWEDDNLCRC